MENGINERILTYAKRFHTTFASIIDGLLKEEENNKEIKIATDCLREAFTYNSIRSSKKSCGMMVVVTVDLLRNGNPTDKEIEEAIYLGCCVQIIVDVSYIADDIMDRSELRRGKPCWYKKSGMRAINDVYLMEKFVYKIIDRYFADNAMQCNILDLYKTFHRSSYLASIGQELDMVLSDNPNKVFSLCDYTMEKYKSMVKYKCACLAFDLPVNLGMRVARVTDPNILIEAECILLKLAEFTQIENDYLDCYGDPAIIGKVGHDIEERKCSWLVIQAMHCASKEDRKNLEANYGKEDKMAVNVVKEIYNKLDLPSIYRSYNERSFKELCQLIEAQREEFPKQMFLFLAHKVYSRHN